MKIKYLLAASTAALIVSGSAQAADIIRSSEPVVSAPAFSWDGFYAGGEIGGSWARSKVQTWGAESNSFKAKPDAFIGGLYAGYNFDAGNNIVLGADTDFVWGDVKGTDTKDGDKLRVKQKWAGSTRLRAGYAMDRFLPYIAGGVAYGKIDSSVRDAAGVTAFSKDKTRAGWTLGAGVDYAMTDNVLLRVEYRYTDFGKKTYYIANQGSNYRVKYNANDFRVGVAYKF